MQPLPSVPLPSAILSFDFDGTLHNPADDPPVPIEFFRVIRKLRERDGLLWGINTGRSLEHLMEALVENSFPFLPDWVVAREREIHFPDTHSRWFPHKTWNHRCEREIDLLFHRARKLLKRIRHEVEEHTGAEWLEFAGEPAGLIARTEEEMAWIVNHVSPIAAEEPLLAWQRNSIYLRFGHRDFHKGSSLTEIARHHHLPVACCFAMGDSHNDLEMLDPIHTGMAACPANSVSEIRDKVKSIGGLVTNKSHGHGAIEALHHFFEI